MKLTFAAAALIAAAVSAPLAEAAQFSIMPVRIFMTPRDRAIAVTVTNEGDQEVVMQADLYTWKQKPDGTDDLVLTEDLILSPPIIKLAPKARQVVRLARLTPPPSTDQQTYRLIVREIPEARPTEQLQLQVALAFSLPVFITPPGAKREMKCSAERAAADTLKVTCENNGNAYAQIRALEVVGSTGEPLASTAVGGYILPGVKRGLEVKRQGGARYPGGKIQVRAAMDDGTVQSIDAVLSE
jgi:fimbrial chaperone protein